MSELSPMMKQYLLTKDEYGDCILFYRLGDFYEMFFEDAVIASKELEIALTGKSCGLPDRAPMCGVPFHSAGTYIAKLVERGFKVAVCEQVEDPKSTKGIVKREVVRVVTPGTALEEIMLDERKNNYLCSVNAQKGEQLWVVFCEVSAGEMYLTSVSGMEALFNELARYSPSEIIINDDADEEIIRQIKKRFLVNVEKLDDGYYHSLLCDERLKAQFKKPLDELGLEPSSSGASAVFAILKYLDETQRNGMKYINRLNKYCVEEYMDIDMATRRNLEITETMREKKKKGSLLGVLDKTRTSMGARLLTQWMQKPLVNPNEINKRLCAVRELVENPMLRDDITAVLSGIYDISRIISRISTNTLTPKDMVSLKNSLIKLPELEYALSKTQSELLSELYNNMDILADICTLLNDAINDEVPASLRDGQVIKKGYNSELEHYRSAINDGASWIARVEAEERERTGIKTLKTGYNKVFGYYIEVTKLNSADVPDTYIRKQTLANAERYITPELKELEETILTASDKFRELELVLFEDVRLEVLEQAERIRAVGRLISIIDVLCSFAVVAAKNDYTMPEITNTDELIIKDGRHPVVEKMLTESLFVPNDTELDCEQSRLLIITGPNMAGKSTYMRQVALITLMAQIGSFVPASYAKVGAVDRIFTRVGASDDISAGQSTFMLEMVEVSNIIKNATKKSLVILDEIGRGTSTYDGMSIARAVAECIHDKEKIGAKTLFATHYHELSSLEESLDGVKNYRIAVKKHGDDITFLRKIVRGGADDSFGIEVAKLAGVPDGVIQRAKQILAELESEDKSAVAPRPKKQREQTEEEVGKTSEIVDELKMLDVTTLTPIEALNTLYGLVNKVKKTDI